MRYSTEKYSYIMGYIHQMGFYNGTYKFPSEIIHDYRGYDEKFRNTNHPYHRGRVAAETEHNRLRNM